VKLTHNAHGVAVKLNAAGRNMASEVQGELRSLASRIAADMRQRAPKHRSTLANSVREQQEGPWAWTVRPNVDYAANVEKGRKPGKGLPRFFDTTAAQIVGWLDARLEGARLAANPKYRRGRVGSARRTAAELELRDRYMALSRHVKLYGIKPHPYVKPTADAWREPAAQALAAAVRRGVQQAGLGQGGAA
jgi:hypothetical protein